MSSMTSTSKLTIGILQFAPKLGNIKENIETIDVLLKNAPHADLWVLPELASSGYNFSTQMEAMAASEHLNHSIFVQFLTEKARERNTLFVSGINERECNRLYNSAIYVGPDGLRGIYRKLHLFHREKLFFEPGNTGIPVFDTPFGKMGMLVCFDWMFPEVWRLMALRGAQIICHPSNLVLPYCQTAIPGYALTNRIFVVTTNRTGTEGDLEFTGKSVLVNPKGEYLLKATQSDEAILTCEINLTDALDKQITPFNEAFDDRRMDVYALSENQQDSNIKAGKKRLRNEIKKIKQKFSTEALKAMGQKVMEKLEKEPQFLEAKIVFIYWSLPDEVPTHEFIERWRDKKLFLLPRIISDHLELRQYTGIESLESSNSYGIREPIGPIFSDFEKIDFAIIPGLAFSTRSARMGRGGGYYDRTLPFLCRAVKWGVAFSFQIMETVPRDNHDINMDKVVYISDEED
jgi:5,10-methenyltetrahydrofolate synthetase